MAATPTSPGPRRSPDPTTGHGVGQLGLRCSLQDACRAHGLEATTRCSSSVSTAAGAASRSAVEPYPEREARRVLAVAFGQGHTDSADATPTAYGANVVGSALRQGRQLRRPWPGSRPRWPSPLVGDGRPGHHLRARWRSTDSPDPVKNMGDEGRAFGGRTSRPTKLAKVGDAENAHHAGELTGIHHLGKVDKRLEENRKDCHRTSTTMPDAPHLPLGHGGGRQRLHGLRRLLGRLLRREQPPGGRQGRSAADGREMGWIRVNRYWGYDKDANSPSESQRRAGRGAALPADDVPAVRPRAAVRTVCPVLGDLPQPSMASTPWSTTAAWARATAPTTAPTSRAGSTTTATSWPEPLQRCSSTPTSSTRTMGVMEKCTFCVQRLRSDEERPGPTSIGVTATWCRTRRVTPHHGVCRGLPQQRHHLRKPGRRRGLRSDRASPRPGSRARTYESSQELNVLLRRHLPGQGHLPPRSAHHGIGAAVTARTTEREHASTSPRPHGDRADGDHADAPEGHEASEGAHHEER